MITNDIENGMVQGNHENDELLSEQEQYEHWLDAQDDAYEAAQDHAMFSND